MSGAYAAGVTAAAIKATPLGCYDWPIATRSVFRRCAMKKNKSPSAGRWANTMASVQFSPRAPDVNRWGQLIIGIICMSMIANLQYGWTLFVNPIDDKFQW